MTKSKQKVAAGVFETRAEADRAVEELQRAGFRRDQIGVAARNADGSVKDTASHGDAEMENAGTGLAAGAAAGAGIGGLIGLGVLAGVVPVIGPAIAAGTLGVILSNAAGGAAIAGLTGALIGWGMTKEDAAYYETEMKAGRYLVTVHTDDRFDEAWRILHLHGAYNRQTPRAATTSTSGRTSTSSRTSNEETMKLHEEQLHVQKQPVNTGEVRVRKEVVTDHKTIDVPVQREEVVIERQRTSGRASSSDIKPGEEIRIPVKEEQVRVSKEAVVKEEVRVGKRQVQDTEHVSGDVRREQVKVEQTGKVDVRDSDKGSTGRKNK